VERYHFEPPGDIMNIEDIIKVPYTTQPRMIRNTGEVYNQNPSDDRILRKYMQLKKFSSDLYGETVDSVSNQLVRRASSFLGKEVTGDIVEFAMNFEEDVAIMHKGVLSSICFCFPSSWVPREGLGKTLAELHAPVADGDVLRRMSPKLSTTMANHSLGSFLRYVWTITKVPNLSCHPDIVKEYKDETVDFNTLYFRVEKQTTLPLLDNNTSLFFVNIEVVPLSKVWNKHKDLIKESLNSMSDAIIEYKNLKEIKTVLSSMD
jgi:hypothetical protein